MLGPHGRDSLRVPVLRDRDKPMWGFDSGGPLGRAAPRGRRGDSRFATSITVPLAAERMGSYSCASAAQQMPCIR